jgi:hypothetical protein
VTHSAGPLEPIQSRARLIGRFLVVDLWRLAGADSRLSRRKQPVEPAALVIDQIPLERVERLLQPGLSGRGDRVAQRSPARPNHVVFEQPSGCGTAQGLTPRRTASNAGEVVNRVLPLGTIAAREAEVSASALEIGEAPGCGCDLPVSCSVSCRTTTGA